MRKANILPIAVMAFAVVAFLFMVDYSINGGKWPWSANIANKISQQTNNASNTVLNTNEVSTTTDTWIAYTSTDLGFSSRYPNTWKVTACGPDYVGFNTIQLNCAAEFSSGYNIVPIKISDVATTIANKKKEIGSPLVVSTTVGGYTATRIAGIGKVFGTDGFFQDHVIVPIGTRALLISYFQDTNKEPADADQFSAFLSTLTFTSPTADWKTYKNSQYGFSIKYPPTLTAKESSTETYYQTTGIVSMSGPAIKNTVRGVGINFIARKLDPNNIFTAYNTGLKSKKTTIDGKIAYYISGSSGGSPFIDYQVATSDEKGILEFVFWGISSDPSDNPSGIVYPWYSDAAARQVVLNTIQLFPGMPGWKTYTFSDQISFKYPPTWTKSDQSSAEAVYFIVPGIDGPRNGLEIRNNLDVQTPLNEWPQRLANELTADLASTSSVEVEGHQVIEAIFKSDEPRYYVIQNGSGIFQFSFSVDEGTARQILNTVKLLSK